MTSFVLPILWKKGFTHICSYNLKAFYVILNKRKAPQIALLIRLTEI